jgi:ABC-type Mn2+/Zn2+ transport system ATPase subunit
MEDVMLHVKIQPPFWQNYQAYAVAAVLEPGRCHQLVGANGSGKTTFFNEMKFAWPRFSQGLQLGFVDQIRFAPAQDLTVAASMDVLTRLVPARLLNTNWRKLECWQDPEVVRWLERPVSTLSGGENQWVKLLMMRSLKSDAWLLDEPFASLDSRRHSELWMLLESWVKSGHYLLLAHHGTVPFEHQRWNLIPTKNGLSLEKDL